MGNGATRVVVASIFCIAASALLVAVQNQSSIGIDLPAFEAVSIKVNNASGTTRSTSRFTPGRYVATAITLRDLVKTSYSLSVNEQIRGGPRWLAFTRFDIQAVATGASQDRMALMIRRLLLERFKLKARMVTEELGVFALTLRRADKTSMSTLKIDLSCQNVTPDAASQLACGEIFLASNTFQAKGVSMNRFAEVLSRSPSLTGAERLVMDRTGLSGVYSFEIKFARSATPGIRVPDSTGLPDFTTALNEQLGLRLESTRLPTNVLIVDEAIVPAIE